MGGRKIFQHKSLFPLPSPKKRGLCFVGTLSATLAIVQVKGLALVFTMTGIPHGSFWLPRPAGICGGHKRCTSMLKWAKVNRLSACFKPSFLRKEEQDSKRKLKWSTEISLMEMSKVGGYLPEMFMCHGQKLGCSYIHIAGWWAPHEINNLYLWIPKDGWQ